MSPHHRSHPSRDHDRRPSQDGPETRGDRYGDYGEHRYRAERSWREDEDDGGYAEEQPSGRRTLLGHYRSGPMENPGYGQSDYARGFGSGPGRFDRGLGERPGVGHYNARTYAPEPYYGSVGQDPRDRGATRLARDDGPERYERPRGPYYGRGPRNYLRSDPRITEDLNERLTDDDHLDAGDIEVQVSEGVATLSGTVSERWMKHRAEDIADSCSGVKDVRNELRIQPSRNE